jgi:hypothetical protein
MTVCCNGKRDTPKVQHGRSPASWYVVSEGAVTGCFIPWLLMPNKLIWKTVSLNGDTIRRTKSHEQSQITHICAVYNRTWNVISVVSSVFSNAWAPPVFSLFTVTKWLSVISSGQSVVIEYLVNKDNLDADGYGRFDICMETPSWASAEAEGGGKHRLSAKMWSTEKCHNWMRRAEI